MPTSVKVTIGIPTYNGVARISNALDSILLQLTPQIATLIEVVVSDNASTDNTASVVASYATRFPCPFKYRKNDINIGYDRNINTLFLHASGKYVWLLADDDALQPDAIEKVLNILTMHKDLKVMQLNFQSYDHELRQVVHQVNISNNLLCDDAQTFLCNSHGRYGQMSSLIFDRLAWNMAGVEKAIGTNYIHIYALLKVLLLGQSYIFREPLVKARMGSENFGTSGDALIATPLGGGKIFLQMREIGYKRKISRKLLLENRRYIFRLIPHAKSKGLAHPIKAAQGLLKVHNCFELWLLWIPVMFIPMVFYRHLYGFLMRFMPTNAKKI